MTQELKLWFNDNDWVIASSPADADDELRKIAADCDEGDWREVTEPVTCNYEQASDSPNGELRVTWKPAEWVAHRGRGYLCSMEW